MTGKSIEQGINQLAFIFINVLVFKNTLCYQVKCNSFAKCRKQFPYFVFQVCFINVPFA